MIKNSVDERGDFISWHKGFGRGAGLERLRIYRLEAVQITTYMQKTISILSRFTCRGSSRGRRFYCTTVRGESPTTRTRRGEDSSHGGHWHCSDWSNFPRVVLDT